MAGKRLIRVIRPFKLPYAHVTLPVGMVCYLHPEGKTEFYTNFSTGEIIWTTFYHITLIDTQLNYYINNKELKYYFVPESEITKVLYF